MTQCDGPFEWWMREVDSHVQKLSGVSVHDLADQPFRDWFDDEMPAREAAELALEDEGFPFAD